MNTGPDLQVTKDTELLWHWADQQAVLIHSHDISQNQRMTQKTWFKLDDQPLWDS